MKPTAAATVNVPGRFFAHKREIEKVEAEKNYQKKHPYTVNSPKDRKGRNGHPDHTIPPRVLLSVKE